MLDGVMLLWFVLAAASLLFVQLITFAPELLSMNFLMTGIADRDDTEEVRRIRRRSDDSELLVRDVNGAARRFRRFLPDKLVAGGEPSQAWHDDRTPCRRECRSARLRCGNRHDRDVAYGA
jgi:hypothetical protein